MYFSFSSKDSKLEKRSQVLVSLQNLHASQSSFLLHFLIHFLKFLTFSNVSSSSTSVGVIPFFLHFCIFKPLLLLSVSSSSSVLLEEVSPLSSLIIISPLIIISHSLRSSSFPHFLHSSFLQRKKLRQ